MYKGSEVWPGNILTPDTAKSCLHGGKIKSWVEGRAASYSQHSQTQGQRESCSSQSRSGHSLCQGLIETHLDHLLFPVIESLGLTDTHYYTQNRQPTRPCCIAQGNSTQYFVMTCKGKESEKE